MKRYNKRNVITGIYVIVFMIVFAVAIGLMIMAIVNYNNAINDPKVSGLNVSLGLGKWFKASNLEMVVDKYCIGMQSSDIYFTYDEAMKVVLDNYSLSMDGLKYWYNPYVELVNSYDLTSLYVWISISIVSGLILIMNTLTYLFNNTDFKYKHIKLRVAIALLGFNIYTAFSIKNDDMVELKEYS